jgi:hypothetical protein
MTHNPIWKDLHATRGEVLNTLDICAGKFSGSRVVILAFDCVDLSHPILHQVVSPHVCTRSHISPPVAARCACDDTLAVLIRDMCEGRLLWQALLGSKKYLLHQ